MKKLLFLLICIAGLLFGRGLAYVLTPSYVTLQNTTIEETNPSALDDSAVLETTRLMVRYSFGGCGHFELKEERLPTSWIGKPASEVSLPGTLFETYENNILYLAKISQEKCNRHFILKAEGNQLVVTYQNDPSKVRDRYQFLPQLLSQKELQSLKKGIYLESTEELSQRLEDYCS